MGTPLKAFRSGSGLGLGFFNGKKSLKSKKGLRLVNKVERKSFWVVTGNGRNRTESLRSGAMADEFGGGFRWKWKYSSKPGLG